MMKKFKALIEAGFKTALAYRFDFFVTIFIMPISLFVFYFLWKSIFEYGGEAVIRGFTFNEMISYYVINSVVLLLTWNMVEKGIEEDVLYGNLISRLKTPMSYFKQRYGFMLGFNLLSLIVEAVPVLVISFFIFSIKIPTLINGIMFIVSVALASVLNFMLSYLVGLSSFWLKKIDGISRAQKPLLMFLGGGVVPLVFFPPMLQPVLSFLPFKYVRSVPITIYLGQHSVPDAMLLIGIQIVWVIMLALAVKGMWRLAFKKFAGAGT